jgi:riboflavin kinase/FMN adenylyltransferase
VLSSNRYKAELLEALGVDVMCVQPFTAEFIRMIPDDFRARAAGGAAARRAVRRGGELPLRPQGRR